MNAPFSSAERQARLRLIRTDGVGPISFADALANYGTAEAALAALPARAAAAGRPFAPPSPASIEAEIAALERQGGRFVFLGEAAYPARLAATEGAPPVLAVGRRIDLLHRPAIAIVGARNASLGGRKIAHTLAAELTASGFAIVSGLARGIDTAAHLGALEAGGGTLACIASGFDQAYPPENRALQSRILEEGCLVAEQTLGALPVARNFPRRNRIIAGLALGVVVVEAAEGSGSLITARLAADQGREVFAVPGSPLDARCRGSNALIRQGASFCESAEDVTSILSPLLGGLGAAISTAPPPPPVPDKPLAGPSDTAAQVIEALGPIPVTVDEVARACHLPAATVLAVLADLELDGRIERCPGNRVARI